MSLKAPKPTQRTPQAAQTTETGTLRPPMSAPKSSLRNPNSQAAGPYMDSMGKAVKVTGVFGSADEANQHCKANPGDGVLCAIRSLVVTAGMDDLGVKPEAIKGNATEGLKVALVKAGAMVVPIHDQSCEVGDPVLVSGGAFNDGIPRILEYLGDRTAFPGAPPNCVVVGGGHTAAPEHAIDRSVVMRIIPPESRSAPQKGSLRPPASAQPLSPAVVGPQKNGLNPWSHVTPAEKRYIQSLERLWDMVSEAVAGGHISEKNLPGGYQAIVDKMKELDALDAVVNRSETAPSKSTQRTLPYNEGSFKFECKHQSSAEDLQAAVGGYLLQQGEGLLVCSMDVAETLRTKKQLTALNDKGFSELAN